MAGQQTTAGRWGEGKPEGSGTHGQESNCVDGQLVKVGVGHDGREGELGTIEREKFQKRCREWGEEERWRRKSSEELLTSC